MNQSDIFAVARQQFDRAGAYMIKSAMPIVTKLVACAILSCNRPADQIRGFYQLCAKKDKGRCLGVRAAELVRTCEAVFVNPMNIRTTDEIGRMSSEELQFYAMCLQKIFDISISERSADNHKSPTTANLSTNHRLQHQDTMSVKNTPARPNHQSQPQNIRQTTPNLTG